MGTGFGFRTGYEVQQGRRYAAYHRGALKVILYNRSFHKFIWLFPGAAGDDISA